MSIGRCLCGSIRWEVLAAPYAMYNCHCRMCQKIHGTGFGTYWFFHPNQIRWAKTSATITYYKSSKYLVRSSCSVCGSVVPYTNKKQDRWVAPGGCHDNMRKPDCNIFVLYNSPWHTVSSKIPSYDTYPEGSGLRNIVGLTAPEKTKGPVQGSCLCRNITYQVKEPFKIAHHCHCSRCRYGRAAAHASNGFVSFNGVEFQKGQNQLKSYKAANARYFTQVFCKACSSLMPSQDEETGITVIPLGSLDNDPIIRPADHIFVNDKAGWHDITDSLPKFPKSPVD